MTIFFKTIGFWVLLVISQWANADGSSEVLPAKAVFIPTIRSITADSIQVDIDIKPAYYLYRERLFDVATANNEITFSAVKLSTGSTKTDQFFGTQSVWYGGKDTATIAITYENPANSPNAEIVLKYQGCQDGVICYPPEQVTLPVTLPTQQTGLGGLLAKPDNLKAAQTSTSAMGRFSSAGAKEQNELFQNKPSDNELLSEENAFPFIVETIDATTLSVKWQIPEGYYLYRDKIQLQALAANEANNNEGDLIAQVQLSAGTSHTDEFYGEQSIYRGGQGVANIYLKQPTDDLNLALTFQGCADQGVCYPVMKRSVLVSNGLAGESVNINTASSAGSISVIDGLTETLKSNLWVGIGLLLLAGIALSFTPCVLPMLPILLGIITNQRKVSKKRAAVLSSAYAVGVATMMAVFGLVVAKTGINIQIIFQQPLWLMLFAGIFILLGLAMLGVFNLAMPNGIQNKVYQWQNRFQDAKPSNLFVVGALSTLVVGPCIAPPLIAVLAFISTTNDSFLGAVYLFALGLGMSLPLVIFATVVTTMPKTGELSRLITRVFALLMFGVGLWLLSRLLPGALSLVFWGGLLLGLAYVFWKSRFASNVGKKAAGGLALLSFAVGMVWVTGGLMGNSNPLKPFTKVLKLPFESVDTLAELNHIVTNSEELVMLDLYADWCVSCQEIEHITFTEPAVVAALQGVKLVKLDITHTTAEHREMLTALNLIGPPALLFFKQGKELSNERNIGVIDAKSLLDKLKRLSK